MRGTIVCYCLKPVLLDCICVSNLQQKSQINIFELKHVLYSTAVLKYFLRNMEPNMQNFPDFSFLSFFSGASWMKGFCIGPSIFLHKLLKNCLQ